MLAATVDTSRRALVLAFAALVTLPAARAASAQKVEVMWLGHSAFRLTSTTGKVIVIDPYLTKNPRTPAKYKDLAALGKVDLILVTHGHNDHIGDLPELARLTGAKVVATTGLIQNLVAAGLLDETRTIHMNKGGTITPLGPGIKVHMVPAEHSSALAVGLLKPGSPGAAEANHVEAGVATGFVIEFENGFRVYDTGDTDVFGDMALIHRFFKPDLALVCIGGHFTMDPERAAFALTEYIKPKHVIPSHYGTYPVLNRTPAELKAALGKSPIKVIEAKPGEPVLF